MIENRCKRKLSGGNTYLILNFSIVNFVRRVSGWIFEKDFCKNEVLRPQARNVGR